MITGVPREDVLCRGVQLLKRQLTFSLISDVGIHAEVLGSVSRADRDGGKQEVPDSVGSLTPYLPLEWLSRLESLRKRVCLHRLVVGGNQLVEVTAPDGLVGVSERRFERVVGAVESLGPVGLNDDFDGRVGGSGEDGFEAVALSAERAFPTVCPASLSQPIVQRLQRRNGLDVERPAPLTKHQDAEPRQIKQIVRASTLDCSRSRECVGDSASRRRGRRFGRGPVRAAGPPGGTVTGIGCDVHEAIPRGAEQLVSGRVRRDRRHERRLGPVGDPSGFEHATGRAVQLLEVGRERPISGLCERLAGFDPERNLVERLDATLPRRHISSTAPITAVLL
nr:hypothetical protein [Haloplanus salinus]